MDTQIFTLLKTAVWALHNAHPLGTAEGQKHWEWFGTYSPGDLVMETSTVWHNHKDPLRFGELISDQQELCYSDEEWEEVKNEYRDQARPTERIVRIRLLKDGTEMAWNNAQFIRVPKEMNTAAYFHIVGAGGREIPRSLIS